MKAKEVCPICGGEVGRSRNKRRYMAG